MKNLPTLLFLASCSQVDPELETKCPKEVQALEESCDRWDGSFSKEVESARICLGNEVKIICSNPGPFEPKTVAITER